jgi:hypothetical protein
MEGKPLFVIARSRRRRGNLKREIIVERTRGLRSDVEISREEMEGAKKRRSGLVVQAGAREEMSHG